jgi:hypothetical protein
MGYQNRKKDNMDLGEMDVASTHQEETSQKKKISKHQSQPDMPRDGQSIVVVSDYDRSSSSVNEAPPITSHTNNLRTIVNSRPVLPSSLKDAFTRSTLVGFSIYKRQSPKRIAPLDRSLLSFKRRAGSIAAGQEQQLPLLDAPGTSHHLDSNRNLPLKKARQDLPRLKDYAKSLGRITKAKRIRR